MAVSSTALVVQKVKNLRTVIMEMAKLNPAVLSNMQLLEHRFLKLPLSHTPDHPTYAAMILTAITELCEEDGSCDEAISEFIKSQYKDLPHAHTSLLNHHLGRLVERREIVRNSKNRYTLPKESNVSNIEPESMNSRIFDCDYTLNNKGGVKNRDELQEQGLAHGEENLREGEERVLTNGVENLPEAEEWNSTNGVENLPEGGGRSLTNGVENLLEGKERNLTKGVGNVLEGEEHTTSSRSEESDVEKEDQIQNERDLTTEAKIHPEGEELNEVLQGENFDDQVFLQNGIVEEKEKQGLLEGRNVDETRRTKEKHGNVIFGQERTESHKDGNLQKEECVETALEREEDQFLTNEAPEENQNEVILGHWEIEIPQETKELREIHTEGEVEANCEEDQSQKEKNQEEEICEVNETEFHEERKDEVLKEANFREEQETMETQVKNQSEDQAFSGAEFETQFQETPNRANGEEHQPEARLLERNEMHKKLLEQQIQACNKITALTKMLEQFTKNRKGDEAAISSPSSNGADQKHDHIRSLPLSKERCMELLTNLNKLGGQLAVIMDSFDEIEMFNHKSDPAIPRQLDSRAAEECDKIDGNDRNYPSQPGFSIGEAGAKLSLQIDKRKKRGRKGFHNFEPGTNTGPETSKSDPEVSRELGSRTAENCDKYEGNDHKNPKSSQPGFSIGETGAKTSFQGKRRGRPPKTKEMDANEKQGRGRTIKQKPTVIANSGLSSSSYPQTYGEAGIKRSKSRRGSRAASMSAMEP